MFQKITTVMFLVISSVACASNDKLWKKYESCGADIEKLALHGSAAMTQQEKDKTECEIKKILQSCLLITPNKKQQQAENLTTSRLIKGDPETPSYDDKYQEVAIDGK